MAGHPICGTKAVLFKGARKPKKNKKFPRLSVALYQVHVDGKDLRIKTQPDFTI